MLVNILAGFNHRAQAWIEAPGLVDITMIRVIRLGMMAHRSFLLYHPLFVR